MFCLYSSLRILGFLLEKCWSKRSWVGVQHGLGVNCVGPGPSQSSRPLPMCYLHKCQQWLPLPHSGAILGLIQLPPLSLPCSRPQWTCTLLSCWSPQPSVELWHGAGGVWESMLQLEHTPSWDGLVLGADKTSAD